MKILLLVLLPVLGVSQDVYKQRMDVHEIWQDYDVCHEDIMVVWGTIADTVFFSYDKRTLKLWSPKKYPNWYLKLKEKTKHNELYELLTDKRGNMYLLRFIRFPEEGIVIFLNGLTNRTFTIHFDFTPNKICL